MSDPDGVRRGDEPLAHALKRAADAAGRAALPAPAALVAARGLRRRRRNLAAAAACAVCLLAGSGAALGLRLQQGEPVPPASVPTQGSPSPAYSTDTPTSSATPSGSPAGSVSSGSPTPSVPPPSFSVTPTTPAR
ncbi:hypothetical protein ACWC9H_16665 [Streptomyces sp. NPDC001251]